MLTDQDLRDIAHPMMNGGSFNNMDAAVAYGRKVLAASGSMLADEDKVLFNAIRHRRNLLEQSKAARAELAEVEAVIFDHYQPKE